MFINQCKIIIFTVYLACLLTTSNLLATPALNISFPLYHNNGEIAWKGVGSNTSEFKYCNRQLAWKGLSWKDRNFSDDASVFHENGKVAWKGASWEQRTYANDAAIYYDNGKIAWKGASWEQRSYANDATVYYENGKITWKGASWKQRSYSDDATVYYDNGKVAWKGALWKQRSYSDDATVYYDNGKVAWKGALWEQRSYSDDAAIYYDNGTKAWSGKSGDPLYDEKGKIINQHVSAVTIELSQGSRLSVDSEVRLWNLNLSLGNGNFLRFSNNALWDLHLSLGHGNYLIHSNNKENTTLLIDLGSDYKLYFYPHTENNPRFFVNNQEIQILK